MKSIDATTFNSIELELVELAQLVVIVTRYIRFAQITLLVYDSGRHIYVPSSAERLIDTLACIRSIIREGGICEGTQ